LDLVSLALAWVRLLLRGQETHISRTIGMGALDLGHIRNHKGGLLRTQAGDHRPRVERATIRWMRLQAAASDVRILASVLAPAGRTCFQDRLQEFSPPGGRALVGHQTEQHSLHVG